MARQLKGIHGSNGVSNGSTLNDFKCPSRPGIGSEGRQIMLKVNHFQVHIPKGYIHHYDISIFPDKCPRRVNRSFFKIHIHWIVDFFLHSLPYEIVFCYAWNILYYNIQLSNGNINYYIYIWHWKMFDMAVGCKLGWKLTGRSSKQWWILTIRKYLTVWSRCSTVVRTSTAGSSCQSDARR